MKAVEGARAQPPAEGFTEPDQVKRFAAAKEKGDVRVLDIEQVYDASWMKGARILITGANRGIGLGLAKEAARCGAVVVGACRKSSKELEAIENVEILDGVEVTSYEACEAMALALEGKPKLDCVINNAGYFPDVSDDFTNGLNFEENLKQYDICAVGPLRVTAALVKRGCVKQPGGKVINITSQGGSALWRQVQNCNEGGDYGHHMCKAAANMCGVLMAEELRPKGIAVANLHPGFNRTDMTRKYEHIWDVEGAVESEVGAKRVMHEIGRVGLLESGAPFINCEDGLLIPY
jgi:NAD(P)-dependent dehydrogenase (short-subunit alcohol dehydrogenase family)